MIAFSKIITNDFCDTLFCKVHAHFFVPTLPLSLEKVMKKGCLHCLLYECGRKRVR